MFDLVVRMIIQRFRVKDVRRSHDIAIVTLRLEDLKIQTEIKIAAFVDLALNLKLTA